MKRITTHVLLILTAAVIVTACEKESVDSKADYFPTPHKAKWSYLTSYIYYRVDEAFVYHKDTSAHQYPLVYQIEKDTIVEGKKYALLTGYIGNAPKRGIRKERNNYYYLDFSYPNRQRERIFLKDNLPIGSSWEEIYSRYKDVYTIKAIAQEKIINGKVYREVIDVEEKRLYQEMNSDQFYPGYSIQHSYAKNVGEIYAYYPYPSLFYLDHMLELLEYTKK